MLSSHSFKKVFFESIAATLVFATVAFMGHMLLEPLQSKAQSASSQFTTKQTIGAEISFLTAASNIVMSPAIGGITGGAATGSTQVVVYTNNGTGYTMTIQASGTPSMKSDGATGNIADYTPVASGTPDFNFVANTSGQSAEFGFTVSASATADLALKFKDNGSNTCNTGAADTGGANSCWTFASTSATSTIVTAGATFASGSTSTVFFHTNVPASPNPNLPNGTYTATTTLTATTNP